MLAIIRSIAILFLSIAICCLGLFLGLFCLRNPCYVSFFGYLFHKMLFLFGIRVEIRYPKEIKLSGNCVYIANHQSNYDIFIVSSIIKNRTAIVGKKSLLWIPLFGIFYWIHGNFFIDRYNVSKAYDTIVRITKNIKKNNISVWIFPEGTRNYNDVLIPFKNGAFYIAVNAQVPIVPVCISDMKNKIKLNRWNNGSVIVEILKPIDTTSYDRQHVRDLSIYCFNLMKNKLHEINQEIESKKDQVYR